MVPWVVVALIAFGVAVLLALADGALLATGHATPRRVIREPERAHRALAMARVLAHLVTGTAIALAVAGATSRDAVAVPIAVAILLVHITLVEGIARGAGYARGMVAVDRLAAFVYVVDLMFLPVTWLGAAVERGIGRLLPPADGTLQREESAERFREVVAAEADVSAAEEELLHGVFTLSDTEVQEIMVPRVDVVGIEQSTPWSEMLDRVRSSEHARFPVFEETLDNVVGILYAKDLLPEVVATREPPEDWSPLIRPATFIPATKTIDQQLRDFKAQRTHIALVMDEYGGTAGVVTIEDVLEEIVGDIRDEYDVEEADIRQEGRERFWVSARVSLADLSELLDKDFQREDITTVGGLVYDAFGRVPRPGEERVIDGFRVIVERVRRRRIERLYLERISAEAAAE
ncbi:MAG TPA: hemolysin family protein [Gemmatimonadaceae bacterium]|nr:hemolysin family protein [Gemmatimonadaceae bacterium]